jgi:hypothetical protein
MRGYVHHRKKHKISILDFWVGQRQMGGRADLAPNTQQVQIDKSRGPPLSTYSTEFSLGSQQLVHNILGRSSSLTRYHQVQVIWARWGVASVEN